MRIVLEDSTVVPFGLLWSADEIYSIEIPDTVTKIERSAIDTTIAVPPVLPPHLKTIEAYACKVTFGEVPVVQLPDSVETLEDDNFRDVKHIAVGKDFRGDVGLLCRNHEQVTIPADSKYLEVKDGFVIDRASKKLLAILLGSFEDSSDVTIRFPEGIASFDSDIVSRYHEVSVFIPNGVEKCKLHLESSRDADAVRAVSCVEGMKEVEISGDYKSDCKLLQKVKLSLPDTVTKLELWNVAPMDFRIPQSVSELALSVAMDELHIPAGTKLKNMNGHINRLYLGQDVTLEGTYPYHLFDDFEGEVFVEGTVHFDEWGKMKDESVIHVQDEEIGRKIFLSQDFNKNVKIYIGDSKLLSEQEEGNQDKRIFNLLGVPDFPHPLQPLEGYNNTPQVVTLLFYLPEKTKVLIETKSRYPRGAQYTLDDKPQKKLNKSIVIPKGTHIVRLIDIDDMSGYDDGPVIEPACEVMLIDDNYSLDSIAKSGLFHLNLSFSSIFFATRPSMFS